MTKTATSKTDWRDTYRALCLDIDRGIFSPGDDLPTLTRLAEQSNLNTYGARRVLERLCKEGRAQSWQGKGFRVAMPDIRFSMHTKRPTFGEAVKGMGLVASSALVSSKTIGIKGKIAARMKARAGTKVHQTNMLRKVGGRPVALSVDYFSRTRLDGIDKTIAQTQSISKSLVIHGVEDYRRDFTELTCRFPTENEAVLLEIPRSQPVYETRGANADKHGEFVQVSCGVWRADCVTYEF